MTVSQELVQGVFEDFLALLESSGCNYALMHQSLSLEDMLMGDIDIVLDDKPNKVILPILEALVNRGRVKLLHNLYYEVPNGVYFVLEVVGSKDFLHLDCLYDPLGINRYLLKTTDLVNRARPCQFGRCLAEADETLYLLIKRTQKKVLDEERLSRLQSLLSSNMESVLERSAYWFGSGSDALIKAIPGSDLEESKELLGELSLKLRHTSLRKRPLKVLGSRLATIFRQVKRLLKPTGLFVVILGPDGCGKSTVTNAVPEMLHRAYRAHWRFHWRPGLVGKLGNSKKKANQSEGNSTEDVAPPDDYRYGYLVSFLRFSYYLIDFVLGYWLVIYPTKARSTLVVGERYFPDVVVNPKRYGFKLPAWVIRGASYFVPKPDLVLVLDGDPEEIFSRKGELSVSEIDSLLKGYRAEAGKWGKYVCINTSGGVEHTVAAVREAILSCQADRMVGLLPSLSRWVAFPSGSRPRLVIQKGRTLKSQLGLFNPHSRAGRLVKRSAENIPDIVAFPLFSSNSLTLEEALFYERATRAISRHYDSECNTTFLIGTPGVHQKRTCEVTTSSGASSYVKIGGQNTKELLENEARFLTWLEDKSWETWTSPRLEGIEDVGGYRFLYQSAGDGEVPGKAREVLEDVIEVSAELTSENQESLDLSLFLKDSYLKDALVSLEHNPKTRGLGKDVEDALLALGKGARVLVGPSHGDFAPWNMLIGERGLFVFDWEYASFGRPISTDLLHYTFVTSRLIEGMGPCKAVTQMIEVLAHPRVKELFGAYFEQEGVVEREVLLYLLGIAARESEGGEVSDYVRDSIVETLVRAGRPKYKRKVLVGAYACEPGKGSEPGVGWNWVRQIAKENAVWVVTKGNNEPPIVKYLQQDGLANVRFLYVDVPRWLSFWKKGGRGIRTYYYLWQFFAWGRTRREHKSLDFDIGHHVTFVNDWIWTFFSLLKLPFIWGPIGSHPAPPPGFYSKGSLLYRELLRYAFQSLVRVCDPLFWLSTARAKRILVINRNSRSFIPLRFVSSHKIAVEPAIAVERLDSSNTSYRKPSKVLFVGRFVKMKGADLVVEAFKKHSIAHPDSILTLIGEGPEEQPLRKLVRSLGVEEKTEISGWMDRNSVLEKMRDSDIFVFPSYEGGGMVVLEAMAFGVPVICLDYGGPGSMVTENSGVRVPVSRREGLIDSLSKALDLLVENETFYQHCSDSGIDEIKGKHLWSSKGLFIDGIYEEVLGSKGGRYVG